MLRILYIIENLLSSGAFVSSELSMTLFDRARLDMWMSVVSTAISLKT